MNTETDAKRVFGRLITKGRGKIGRTKFAKRAHVSITLMNCIEHASIPSNIKGEELVRVIRHTRLSSDDKSDAYNQLKKFCSNCPPLWEKNRRVRLNVSILFLRKPNRQGRWSQIQSFSF